MKEKILFRVAAGLTIITVLGDILAMLSVPGYNPIAQTISELAAGRGEQYEDLGLIALAISLAITAVLLARSPGKDWRDYIGLAAIGVMAITVTLLALWNSYDAPGPGMETQSFAYTAHRKMVWIIGGAFFATATFLAKPLADTGADHAKKWSLALGFIWLVTAPIFFFVPTGMDGLYERGLAAMVIAWIWIAGAAFSQANSS